MSSAPSESNPVLSYSDLEPMLSSSEWLILSQLDPKNRLASEVKAAVMNTEAHKAYVSRVKTGEETIPGVVPGRFGTKATQFREVERDEVVGKGRCTRGGFGIAAAIPFVLPIVGPLISEGISALIGLFKKKKPAGSGPYAPNARSGGRLTARESSAINRLMKENEGRLMQLEEDLKSLRGKAFWRELSASVKDEIAEMAPQVLPDISPEVAPQIADAVVAKIIPRSMQKYADTGKDKDPETMTAKGGLSIVSAAKAKAKWVLGKIFRGNKALNSMRKTVNRIAKSIEERTRDSEPSGGAAWWDKVASMAIQLATESIPKALNDATAGIGSLIVKLLSQSQPPRGYGPIPGNARGGQFATFTSKPARVNGTVSYIAQPRYGKGAFSTPDVMPGPGGVHPFHEWRKENPGGSLKEWMMTRRSESGPGRAAYKRAGEENARRAKRGERPLLISPGPRGGKKKAMPGGPFIVKML